MIKKQVIIDWSIVTSIQQLKYIESSWELLNQLSDNGCIFTSPDWLLNWLNLYWQPEWQLYVLVGRVNSEIIAIAPFFIQKKTTGGCLRFIGTGELEQEEVTSEYVDILCKSGIQFEVVKSMAHQILEAKNCLQSLEFNRVLDSSLISKVVNLLSGKFFIEKKQTGLRYKVNLMGLSWQGYLNKLKSKNFKKKLQQCQRRLEVIPLSEYNIISDSRSIQSVYPKLVELHQKAWGEKGKKGAFFTRQFNQFHLDFIKKTKNSNNVTFLVLKVEEKIIAVFYYIIDKNCCCYYQSGIERDFRPNMSPGMLGHALMLQYCIENNLKCYDFMMGNAIKSYKSKFNPNTEKMFDICLEKKNFSGRFSHFKWLLKKIKHYRFL